MRVLITAAASSGFMCVLRVYEWLGRKICTQKQNVNESSHMIIGMVGSHSREGKGKIDARGMGKCRDVGSCVVSSGGWERARKL